MSKTIETKLVSPPHTKKLHIDCVNCYTRFKLSIPVELMEGVIECDVCGAVTSWREVEKLTTLERDAIVESKYDTLRG